MDDFRNLWALIQNFLEIQFTLYGFTLSWGQVLMYSLIGSLFVGVLVALFKMHE